MAIAPRTADAVQVGLGGLGEVEVHHHVHRLDVDTAREEVWWARTEGGETLGIEEIARI